MPDTPKYYAVLTEAGAALEARALAEGRGVVLTHIAIGDANLEEVTPDPAVTELVHEVHRRPIDAKSLDEDDPRITLLHAVIPAAEGGFWIREMGVIGRLEDTEDEADNPDVLYAYANHAPYYKMLPQDGQTVTHELTVPIVQASNARLIIQVSDEGYATRRQFQDLNERVDELEKIFTPPAEDGPGKKGLVPAPGAMAMPGAESHYLGADGEWHSVKFIPPADAELYVAIDGSDELDEGRGWSADKPFKTIQAALDYAAAHLILDRDFTINVAAGTYEEDIELPRIQSKGVSKNLIIQGPATGTDTITWSAYTITARGCTPTTMRNLTLSCTGSSMSSSVMAEHCKIRFENCAFVGRRAIHGYGYAHIAVQDSVINCTVSTTYVIMLQGPYDELQMVGTIKVSGSCDRFAFVDTQSCVIVYQATFSGTMTGQRYTIYRGAFIYTGGKGANFLPGNTAGTVETQSGAVYY